MALSVVGFPHRIEHLIERNGKAIFACAVLAVGSYIALSMPGPTAHWLDWVPVTDRNAQFTVGFAALALAGFAVWRYYQAYLFARLPSQLAMIATLVILLEVQVIIIWGQVWHLSWWLDRKSTRLNSSH